MNRMNVSFFVHLSTCQNPGRPSWAAAGFTGPTASLYLHGEQKEAKSTGVPEFF
jgi:hypothetical protein